MFGLNSSSDQRMWLEESVWALSLWSTSEFLKIEVNGNKIGNGLNTEWG